MVFKWDMYGIDKIANSIHTLLHIRNTDIYHLKNVCESKTLKKTFEAKILIILKVRSRLDV